MQVLVLLTVPETCRNRGTPVMQPEVCEETPDRIASLIPIRLWLPLSKDNILEAARTREQAHVPDENF